MFSKLAILVAVATLCAWGQFKEPQAAAQPNVTPPGLIGVGIEQRLNEQVPLDVPLRDEAGRTVSLRSYLGSKPVVLALVYFECPMLCTEVLNGMIGSLKGVPLTPGKDFEVLAVSFDPKDDAKLAALKKVNYVRRYGRPGTEAAFHFLTGDLPSIQAITRAVGFHYRWDEKNQQFAHASAIYVLTPQGRMSKYFYGVEYAPRDLRLGLVEASHNKIGTAVDQLLLFCYHYDPATGKYGAVAMNILRLVGVVFLVLLAATLFVFWRRDIRRDRRIVEATR